MSLPAPPWPARPLDERLAQLEQSGRLVELADVDGGEAVHTGFGYGPEFWLLPDGADPDRAVIDVRQAEVVGARLLVEDGRPVADAAKVSKTLKVTVRIPQI